MIGTRIFSKNTQSESNMKRQGLIGRVLQDFCRCSTVSLHVRSFSTPVESISALSSDSKKSDLSNTMHCKDDHSMSTRPVTKPSILRRTYGEINELVAQRVVERDSWIVHGVSADEIRKARPPRDVSRFFTKILPKYMRFTIPSQSELDQMFPVQRVNWNLVNKYHAPIRTMRDSSETCFHNEIQVTWLGHSSLLVQMDGCNIVTDPIFSQRCSPSQWIGPKRYRSPPCSVQDLMTKVSHSINNRAIDVVLISHNHYDHLDYNTIIEMLRYCSDTQTDEVSLQPPIFVVPLGMKEWFQAYISDDLTIYELDWHDTIRLNGYNVEVTCLPMRHWTNRVGDRDKCLWCGYKVTTADTSNNIRQKKFLFSGDTAWFDGLYDLGRRYGPFDVAAIPIGAYEPWEFMKYTHINPTEAVLMKDAIQATYAVPIHYGTFPLTTEAVLDPIIQLDQLMKNRDDSNSFVPWLIGDTKQFFIK